MMRPTGAEVDVEPNPISVMPGRRDFFHIKKAIIRSMVLAHSLSVHVFGFVPRVMCLAVLCLCVFESLTTPPHLCTAHARLCSREARGTEVRDSLLFLPNHSY